MAMRLLLHDGPFCLCVLDDAEMYVDEMGLDGDDYTELGELVADSIRLFRAQRAARQAGPAEPPGGSDDAG